MAKTKKKLSEDTIVDVGQVYSKSELFFRDNKKKITYVAAALVVIVGGYFAYNHFVMGPKIEGSQAAAWNATFDWENDSLTTALDGTVDYRGLKYVYQEFDGTPEGDLANYKLGMAFLNMGQFQEAIDHLSLVDYDDQMVGPMAHGCIGDALMELGQTNEAIAYYDEAAELGDNELITPYFLKKAGMALQALNQYDEALTRYHRIEDEFPYSNEGRDIEKFIAYCEAL